MALDSVFNVPKIDFFFIAEVAMKKYFMNFIREEEGAGLVEYALLVALIAIVALAAVTTLGTTISGVFTTIDGKL